MRKKIDTSILIWIITGCVAIILIVLQFAGIPIAEKIFIFSIFNIGTINLIVNAFLLILTIYIVYMIFKWIINLINTKTERG